MSRPREIGSEFWNVPVGNAECGLFPTGTIWLQSGRHALAAVIEDMASRREIRSVGMPSWCCDSMVRPFAGRGIDVVFYPVTVGGDGLYQDASAAYGCDALLVMDYFGWKNAPAIGGYDGIVIRDLTHSLLSPSLDEHCDYAFGSLRKWCGVWTGGFAWREGGDELHARVTPADGKYVSLRREAMEAKARYIERGVGDKSFLRTFGEAEEMLEAGAGTVAADLRDVELAERLDADTIRKSRLGNAMALYEGMGMLNGIVPIMPEPTRRDCPLFVPVLLGGRHRRDSLRSHLTANEVYCPVHWPVTGLHRPGRETSVVYERGLSLVCDQRYGIDEMYRIIDLVREWLRTN